MKLEDYKYGDSMRNEMVQLYIESEFESLKSKSSKVVSILLDYMKEEVKDDYKKGAYCKQQINYTINNKLDYLINNTNYEVCKELMKLQFETYYH